VYSVCAVLRHCPYLFVYLHTQLLMLDSEAELNEVVAQRGWNVNHSQLTFPSEGSSSASARVPAKNVLIQTLNYASELERIV
jgi:hypothetical protein